MNPSTPTLDPRGFITPDAFDVSENLLGMPLASPRRRLLALAIDLAVIGLLTIVTKSFALILGVVAAIFFMRAGFKRTKVKNSVFGRAMRLSVGCLGVFIAIITASMWALFGIDFGDGGDRDTPSVVESAIQGAGAGFGALAGVASGLELADADNLDDAQDAIRGIVEETRELGMPDDESRAIIEALLDDDSEWRSAALSYFDRLVEPEIDEADLAEQVAAAREAAEDMTPAEAFRALAALSEEEDADVQSPMYQALQDRVRTDVAGDTLQTLTGRVGDLSGALRRERSDHADTQTALDEELNGGLFNALRTFVDELGFGFGWASLYLTIFLSWWNGQTIGKRMMKVRVVRLDGEPITWWIAFERAGGYAAGFATGLLGFAQVYWDSNRQTIHDRIVATAVVMDGAQRVEDWEAAL